MGEIINNKELLGPLLPVPDWASFRCPFTLMLQFWVITSDQIRRNIPFNSSLGAGGEARMRPLDQAGLLYMNYFMDQPEERLDFGTLSSHTDSETGFDIKEEADSVADESLSSVHLQPVTDSDVFRCLTEDCVFHSDADDEDGASSSATTRPPTPRLCGAACQERREVLQLMKENELQRRHLIHQRRQLAVKEDALLTLQLFKAQHEIRCLVQANPHLRLPDQVQKWLHWCASPPLPRRKKKPVDLVGYPPFWLNH